MVSLLSYLIKRLSLLMAFIFIAGVSISAQEIAVASDEKNIELSHLIDIAKDVEFDDRLSKNIHEGNTNNYYVVNAGGLESKYEKIRLLELSYSDDVLVSIGMNDNKTQFFFLVNNQLNTSHEDIELLFNRFADKAASEMTNLNDEQMRLWLIQHDKYFKK